MGSFAEQISAYRRLLPQIKKERGAVWAVLVDSQLKGTFSEFSDAAKFSLEKFPDQEVLIRHTDELQETVPFLVIEG